MTCRPNHETKTKASDAAYAATDHDGEVPYVSPVIGVGDDAHRMVKVGEWGFTVWANSPQSEPLILDLDLGARLGYGRSRRVRELIERLEKDGKLPGISKRRAVRPYELRPGVMHPGREEDEYWLTEAQALYVAAKSDTDAADALLQEMIRVYTLAKAGLLPQQSSGVSRADIAAIVNEALGPVLARLASSTPPLAHTPGIGAKLARKDVKLPLIEIAKWEAASLGKRGDKAIIRSLRAMAEKALRRDLGFIADKGAAWTMFPLRRLAEANLIVDRMLGGVMAKAKLVGITTLEPSLFDKVGAK